MIKIKDRYMKIYTIAIILLAVTALNYAQFSGEGEGTADIPYLVANATHLNEVRNFLNDINVHFRQTADITDLGEDFPAWTPIGTTANRFRGIYDGNGYEIRNLQSANMPITFGLFSATRSANLKDIHLVNINVLGSQGNSGTLVGMADDSTITGCSATGILRTMQNTNFGGLIGTATGFTTISHCWTDVEIIPRDNYVGGRSVGGLVGGYTGNGQVTSSFALGKVRTDFAAGNAVIGGLIGNFTNGTVSDCYAMGEVISSADMHRVGGLIGNSEATVVNCFSIGRVSSEGNEVGGLLGRSTAGVTSSYWNVETSGLLESAGGQGLSTGAMLNGASFVNWSFTGEEPVWQIAAASYPFLTWEGEPGDHSFPPAQLPPSDLRATISEDNDVIRLTWTAPTVIAPAGYNIYRNNERINEQLIVQAQYNDNEVSEWVPYSYFVRAVYAVEQEFVESENSLPVWVLIRVFQGGRGSEEDPYLINNPYQLDGIKYELDAHYRMSGNIDLGIEPWNEEEGWEPIGPVFRGTLDGNGFQIMNLTINKEETEKIGLLAELNGAIIFNVKLTDVSVVGGISTGGFSGSAVNSVIIDSNISGNVLGTVNVGGIIGNGENVQVIRCYSSGSVKGINYASNVGGIIGTSAAASRIIDSYSNMAVVTNISHAGGLIGYNINGSIVRSYAAGSVSSINPGTNTGGLIGQHINGEVNNSVWNRQTTGQEFSQGGGTSLLMTEMLTSEHFENAGWDFPDVWRIDNEESYPYLASQQNRGRHNIPGPFSLTAETDYDALSVELEWEMTGNPARYTIYRDNEVIGSVNHPTLQFLDTEREAFTSYNYYVKAMFTDEEQEYSSSRSNTVRTVLIPPYTGGDGSVANPYQIETFLQLNNVRYGPDKHYVLLNDIDLTEEEEWITIGNDYERFTGSIDGNGYSIIGMTITERGNYKGLIAALENGVIKNLHLSDVSLTNTGEYSGGLIGKATASIITNCSVSGTMFSTGIFSGGFIGYISSGTEVVDCFSNVNVTTSSTRASTFIGGTEGGIVRNSASTGSVTTTAGDHWVNIGGLIGLNTLSSVISCFSRSSVTAPANARNVGGLIGYSSGQVTGSYSAGEIDAGDQPSVGGLIGANAGAVSSSYWDTELSGYTRSAGGLGRTSEQMRYPYQQPGMVYIGWDFENTWFHDRTREENDGYPFLICFPFAVNQNPEIASNPQPQHQENNISIKLTQLQWKYMENVFFTNPRGFRVYLNTTGEFGDEDDFGWVPFEAGEENYLTSEILTEELLYNKTYYWKVVPTTIEPDRRRGEYHSPSRQRAESREQRAEERGRCQIAKSSQLTTHNSQLATRGDAQDVPIWSFTTEIIPYPAIAKNPQPEDEAEGVSVLLEQLAWEYHIDVNHTDPVGFRVYLNTTGEFDDEDDFVWVDHIDNQTTYSTAEIMPEELFYNTTYYWKVVPTTNELRAKSRVHRATNLERHTVSRGDAQDVAIWSFTTLDPTSIDTDNIPTYMTALYHNYPNPFNPETAIRFSLAEPQEVVLTVFNVKGQLVKTIVSSYLGAGEHLVAWNGRDDKNRQVSSGLYFYRLSAASYVKTRNMILIK